MSNRDNPRNNPNPTVGFIRDFVDELTPEIIDIRRRIHAEPELSWCEERTTELVANYLDKANVAVTLLDHTGLFADLGPSEGPIVALRADLDALPIDDTTSDPWKSKIPGVAHACGHDIHTTALLGAGLALAKTHQKVGLPFRVRLIFQPAEESMPGGALKMMNSGAIAGVSRMFALHSDPSLDVGHIGVREGAITGASDRVSVKLSGRGGHTSRPHLTEDLTFAIGAIITQLPAVLSRRFDPRAGLSMVWGEVKAGNTANVIPQSGELAGTVRMLDAQAWHQAEHIVRELITEIVAPFKVGLEINYVRGVPPVVNEFHATETMRAAVAEILGPHSVSATSQSLGGEDFAWYLESVPGAMARLGTRTPGGVTYDLHQGNFRADERAVAIGAKVLASCAVR